MEEEEAHTPSSASSFIYPTAQELPPRPPLAIDYNYEHFFVTGKLKYLVLLIFLSSSSSIMFVLVF